MESQASSNAPVGAGRIGLGRFQWNGGGWFGSLFGMTAWLVLGSILALQQNPTLAAIWAACGLIPVSAGVWMWSQRDRLLPFPALRTLILMCWVSSTVAVISMLKLAPDFAAQYGASNKWTLIAPFLMFPSILIQFTLLEHSAKSEA